MLGTTVMVMQPQDSLISRQSPMVRGKPEAESPQTENSQSVRGKGSCHSGSSTRMEIYHTPRKDISYLWNFRPILLARAWSSNTVWPHAALISFHSTGTLGRRPSLKLLIVPNCPLCLQIAEGQGKYRENLKISNFWDFVLSPKT